MYIIILIYVCDLGSKYRGRARARPEWGPHSVLDKMTVFFSINKTKKTPGALERDLSLVNCKLELKVKKKKFLNV